MSKTSDFWKNRSVLITGGTGSLGKKLKSYGVVFNTDPSTKGGQHWVSLYINLDTTGCIKDPYTIEYFNSSGESIQDRNFKQFLLNLSIDISNKTKKCCIFVNVTNIQHQGLDPIIGDRSGNCGIYSLYYIFARLEGIPYSYFNIEQRPLTDKIITNFRENIFRTIK